ncbi:MAG: FAD-dependent oxidoreductase [Bryobacterales bacterium]|nr:FAD-dependent oxidoreductase [Bryobacterales bacterium]
MTPSVIIAGGGLAGLSAAAALGSAGFKVDLFEARPFLGGRATSFPLSPSDPDSECIDNCQHVLLRCCVNLLDFYRRLGVADRIRFYSDFHFVEPGGRVSVLTRGALPAPLHFAGSFARLKFLDARDKLAILRALAAIRKESGRRTDLDGISMLDWLLEKEQTPRAVGRFWSQVLVSAVNEELNRMAASHGFQVIHTGFLSSRTAYEMGVPAVPLARLYEPDAWTRVGDVSIHLRCPVECIRPEGVEAGGQQRQADYYICAIPPDRLATAAPALGVDTSWLSYSPITSIHLWFDRPVTGLPHATLLDRTIQWMFNKSEGRYVQLVVSASRSLVDLGRNQLIEMARRELAEFFPEARYAGLRQAHVIKELHATYSAAPGAGSLRPDTATAWPKLFLAGDWTRSGWPATMEGAVRSGYRAAEAVTRAAGRPQRFLLPGVG